MVALKEKNLSYEDSRQQRLEENKRRLQELGIASLSKNISNAFKKTKTVTPKLPAKLKLKSEQTFDSRRSSRIAQMPAPIYKDMAEDTPRLRRSASGAQRVTRKVCSFVSAKARDEASDAASNIKTEHPSFVKRMLPSHVSSCFWLGLPLAFCKVNLPQKDLTMSLVLKDGQEWESLYLARKTGLSAGWKRFAEENELSDGDAVVFELVEFNKFLVHIVRVNEDGSANHDGK